MGASAKVDWLLDFYMHINIYPFSELELSCPFSDCCRYLHLAKIDCPRFSEEEEASSPGKEGIHFLYFFCLVQSLWKPLQSKQGTPVVLHRVSKMI